MDPRAIAVRASKCSLLPRQDGGAAPRRRIDGKHLVEQDEHKTRSIKQSKRIKPFNKQK